MHREEVEILLEKFGFLVGLCEKRAKTPMIHIMRFKQEPLSIIDYTADEEKNIIRLIWAYTNDRLDCIDDITDLKNWLGE
jgi:hypothetical protein